MARHHYRPSKDQRQRAAYFESLAAPLRSSGCSGRERFPSKTDAKRAAAKRLRPYRCALCNGWHLTERGR